MISIVRYYNTGTSHPYKTVRQDRHKAGGEQIFRKCYNFALNKSFTGRNGCNFLYVKKNSGRLVRQVHFSQAAFAGNEYSILKPKLECKD